MKRTWLIASLALALMSWSAPVSAAPVRAYVSVPPLAYFAQRIGGRLVDVGILVPPGAEPHTFEPTPKQVASLTSAQVFFAVGFPFEQRLLGKLKAANPALLVVDTRRGLPLRAVSEGEAEPEGPEPGHHHGAGEPDVHVWMSPRLAKLISANICAGLQTADPAHAADYGRNLRAFQSALDKLDARLTRALAPFKGKEFLVYHPAFGYFADAYGLKQVPVEMEGKEPSARQLANLIDLARARRIKVVFVEPQFPRLSAERVAQSIGGVVVPLDALSQDYMGNLEEVAARLQAALGGR